MRPRFFALPGSTAVWRALAGLTLAVLFLTGCANYHVGTNGVLSFQTLYVAPVANKTLVPQAQAIVTTALREEFLHDGRVTLVNSPEEANATLTVTLVSYEREVAAARTNDTGLARKFILTLGSKATLHDNRSGKDLFEGRSLSAARDAFTDNGQQQAEYQTLPLLAEALAKKTAHAALDVW